MDPIKIIAYCCDCGKVLPRKRSKRCHPCGAKHMWKTSEKLQNRDNSGSKNPMFGRSKENHPRWKGGNPKCLDCGKTIKHGYKRCHVCAAKNNWKTSEKLQNRDFYGVKNPNYINGNGSLPYPMKFSAKLKKIIRNRDNYTCQKCKMSEEEHLIVYKQVLHVHHIDYNKNNCLEVNLMTLCNPCNTRANYNREYWKEFYNRIMEAKNYESIQT